MSCEKAGFPPVRLAQVAYGVTDSLPHAQHSPHSMRTIPDSFIHPSASGGEKYIPRSLRFLDYLKSLQNVFFGPKSRFPGVHINASGRFYNLRLTLILYNEKM